MTFINAAKVVFRVLITPEFWSKIGFFISYIITSLLVLEILRLVYTDVNKREVEKMLDTYTRTRTRSTTPRATSGERVKISLDELEHIHTPQQRRVPSPAVTPESERTLVDAQRVSRRRMASVSHPVSHPVPTAPAQSHSISPPRRLRKRSDTLASSSSGEVRGAVRRRREVSPASVAESSKTSSRHASPTPRSKEAKMGGTLGKMLRSRG